MVENGRVDAVSHGGSVLLFIACKHGVDDDARFPVDSAQLPIGGALWIRRAPSVATGLVRSELRDGDGGTTG
jgi:hypothetical protein